MTDQKLLASAYEAAYRENKPLLMNEHLHTFEDCVWLFENSVREFKRISLKKASSKTETWDQFKWVMQKTYSYLLVERITKKIKDTKEEIRKIWK